MSIIKFAMATIGLAACIFNFLPAATAASFDKYSKNTTIPFPVKAFDSTGWYLNQTTADGVWSDIYLTPLGVVADQMIGILYTPNGMNALGAIWHPGVYSYVCPSPSVHLTDENGIDEYGNVKLVVDEPQACFSAGGGTYSNFTASRAPAQRLTALNGDQIEVVPIIIRSNGNLWATYYFGYGVGVVAADSLNAPLAVPAFTPASLPPPKADGTVVEYVNTLDFPGAPGGHYFYTADPAEQAGIDAGGAGRFVRTGRSFASGGFVPVCRFYGSMSPGPNSHFFTASEIECIGLKAMQLTPTPATVQQWNYEGPGFYSVVPVPDAQGQMQCMAGTEPVYRAYNNAYPTSGGKNSWDSNHRYSTQSADIDEMVAKGWRSEGVVLCAPIAAQ